MFNCKKEEEVDFKRALEMLQAELWLVVSMRKCSVLFSSTSLSLLSHSSVFLSFKASVCLFGLSFSKTYFASSAILTHGGVWKSVQSS